MAPRVTLGLARPRTCADARVTESNQLRTSFPGFHTRPLPSHSGASEPRACADARVRAMESKQPCVHPKFNQIDSVGEAIGVKEKSAVNKASDALNKAAKDAESAGNKAAKDAEKAVNKAADDLKKA